MKLLLQKIILLPTLLMLPFVRAADITCLSSMQTPSDVYYEAEIQIETSYLRYQCWDSEIIEVGNFIDRYWDQFVAENDVLGPVQIFREAGSSCPRRRLVEVEEEPEDASVVVDHGEEDSHRNLGFSNSCTGPFCYKGSGMCRFCSADNRDDRRRLTGTTPVTLTLQTDAFPQETAYRIKDANGQVIAEHVAVASLHKRTFFLNAGQTYYFEAIDGYGDGWCCNFGNGNAVIREGTSSQTGSVLLNFNGVFGTTYTTAFYVPPSSVDYGSSAESTFEMNVIPQLEEDISQYLTYYVQAYYNNNRRHCLYRSRPTVWVDLIAKSDKPISSC